MRWISNLVTKRLNIERFKWLWWSFKRSRSAFHFPILHINLSSSEMLNLIHSDLIYKSMLARLLLASYHGTTQIITFRSSEICATNVMLNINSVGFTKLKGNSSQGGFNPSPYCMSSSTKSFTLCFGSVMYCPCVKELTKSTPKSIKHTKEIR